MRDLGSVLNNLSRLSGWIAEVLAYLAGLLFLVLSVYITLDVLSRYAGLGSSKIGDDLSSYALAIGGTFGLAHALRVDGHIRVDLVSDLFRGVTRRLFLLIVAAGTALFSGLLAWYGWGLAVESFVLDIRSITVLQAPMFVPQGLVALGFTLLAIEALIHLAATALRLRQVS